MTNAAPPADKADDGRQKPPLVTSSIEAGVCTITLQDEARRNALSRQLVLQLNATMDDADADPAVRVIVITNSGSVFCAGADLSERSADRDTGSTSEDDEFGSDPLTLFKRIPESNKPYVGRIAGHCVAGGMGLAAAMDISIAIEDVKMGFTEVRIGVAPAIISVLCLPKMNQADARDAFLRGRRFPASEAARLGLINKAVRPEDLDSTVAGVVDDLLAAGPKALAAAKQLLARVPGMPTEKAFEWTGQLSGQLFRSDEAKAGMTAYLNKQPAPWVPEKKY